MYYILIETKAVVSDLLRKYKTEWWQRKIRDFEGRENGARVIAYWRVVGVYCNPEGTTKWGIGKFTTPVATTVPTISLYSPLTSLYVLHVQYFHPILFYYKYLNVIFEVFKAINTSIAVFWDAKWCIRRYLATNSLISRSPSLYIFFSSLLLLPLPDSNHPPFLKRFKSQIFH